MTQTMFSDQNETKLDYQQQKDTWKNHKYLEINQYTSKQPISQKKQYRMWKIFQIK